MSTAQPLRLLWLVLALLAGQLPATLQALVFAATNDPAFPTGKAELPFRSQPGNRSVGWFSTFAGAVIAPNYALTARHTGSQMGSVFYNDGRIYRAAESYSVAGTDLQVVRITTERGGPASLRRPAALGATNDTAGTAVQVYGFGSYHNNGREIRGTIPQISVVADPHGPLLGWDTSPGKKERWGHNRIKFVTPDRFYFTFDPAGAGDWIDRFECGATMQDSGGPVFIGERLVGIISQRTWPAGNQAIFGTVIWCERVSAARPAILRPTRGTFAAPLATNEIAILEVIATNTPSGVAGVTFSQWGGAAVKDEGEILRDGVWWRGYRAVHPSKAITWLGGVVNLEEDLRGKPAIGVNVLEQGSGVGLAWRRLDALPARQPDLLLRRDPQGKLIVLPDEVTRQAPGLPLPAPLGGGRF